jgi:hypothetical protein
VCEDKVFECDQGREQSEQFPKVLNSENTKLYSEMLRSKSARGICFKKA